MATLSVSSGNYIQSSGRYVDKGNAAPEGASQTFPLGGLLKFSSTAGHENEVIACGSDPAAVVGVAMTAASGTQGNQISYLIPMEDSEFIGNVVDGQTTDYTDVGVAYGVAYDSTYKIWRVDKTDTTNTVVVVTALAQDPVTGDYENTNGQVFFKFKASVRVPFNG